MERPLRLLIVVTVILFFTSGVNAEYIEPIALDPNCGIIGHAHCVPGVNSPRAEQSAQATPGYQSTTTQDIQPSVCGSIGQPPCIPGINAPLPPKKMFGVISVPTSNTTQVFDVLDAPYRIALVNSRQPFDLVVRLAPYTEPQQHTETYQRERKLIPRAYEDPDMRGQSSEYVFEIAAKRDQQPINNLPNPITITLPWPSEHYMKKIIHYWDGNKNDWFPLESFSNVENKTVSALWHLPYGQFAVFDSTDVFEGIASWYEYKGCNCAAIKEFKHGTKFRVTNITDKSPRYGRSVIVTINDYGPAAWTRRLIDLDKVAFRKIANPWNGLAMVRVELLQ